MPATVALMTVEEFRQLPDSEAHILELRNGEVARVTRPKKRHDDRVYRIRRMLQPVADELGYLEREFAFRPAAEHELRVADLAFVTWDRWNRVDEDDNLHGAPDFVVEVASPSNTAEELQEKKELCLSNGCLEFWIVYPKLKQVEVSTPAGIRCYRLTETITLTSIPGSIIHVDRIFG